MAASSLDARRGVTRAQQVVRALFVESLLVLMALLKAHYRTEKRTLSQGAHGVVSSGFASFLVAGYAWFSYFQPPAVFRGLGRES